MLLFKTKNQMYMTQINASLTINSNRRVIKRTTIFYWIFTSLFAVLMLGSAIPDVFSAKIAIEGMGQLGYPAYFVPFIGVAKLLGVIAILVPGFPKLREWAYAGLVFDLIGATYSIIAAGAPVANWAPMALPLVLAACSYVFYRRKLAATSTN
jgi:hypothetical protein